MLLFSLIQPQSRPQQTPPAPGLAGACVQAHTVGLAVSLGSPIPREAAAPVHPQQPSLHPRGPMQLTRAGRQNWGSLGAIGRERQPWGLTQSLGGSPAKETRPDSHGCPPSLGCPRLISQRLGHSRQLHPCCSLRVGAAPVTGWDGA